MSFLGYLFDHVVGSGGTALFGENTEIIGAEHILAKRAISDAVGRSIIDVALATEERAKGYGEDIRSINPVPANIAGGISTLEEAGERLGELSRQVASGSMTKTETIKYQEPSQVYLQDSPF